MAVDGRIAVARTPVRQTRSWRVPFQRPSLMGGEFEAVSEALASAHSPIVASDPWSSCCTRGVCC